MVRNFAIQSSTLCTIPSNAQAYSFNVTVVPPGSLGALTLWPEGQTQPNVVTIDDVPGDIRNDAAIVPAGTPNGGISAITNGTTDLVLDINGYYAPSTGITLAQGTASAPSLSFAGGAGTGLFSSGAGTLNFTTAGTTALTIQSNGNLNLTGNILQNGSLFLSDLGTANLGVGLSALADNTTGFNNTALGFDALVSNTTGGSNTAMGAGAGDDMTTGSNNTAVGAVAGSNITTGSNNIDIGNQGTASDGTATNSGVIRIGTSGTQNVLLRGWHQRRHRALWRGGLDRHGRPTGDDELFTPV